MLFPDRPYNNPTRVLCAAKDSVSLPTEPAVLAIIEKALCIPSLGHNCYVLTNVYGTEAEVPYGASLEQWEKIANDLLDKALREAP